MLLLFLSVAIFLIDFSFWLFTEYKRSSKNTFAFFPFPFLLKLWYLPTDGEARTNVRTNSVDNWRLRAERYGEIVSLYLLVSLIWFLFLTLSLLISCTFLINSVTRIYKWRLFFSLYLTSKDVLRNHITIFSLRFVYHIRVYKYSPGPKWGTA